MDAHLWWGDVESHVERAAHRRAEPALMAQLSQLPSTRVVLTQAGRAATRDGQVWLAHPTEVLDITQAPDALWSFLGEDTHGAYLGLTLPQGDAPELPNGFSWVTLRTLLQQDQESTPTRLAHWLVALSAWHESHQFCARCGSPTTVGQAGWVRHCTREGVSLFPRTDPAVIMAITDPQERLLLARASRFPPRNMSVLAGFVEPGESAEDAVRRETLEEVSLRVSQVSYVSSQSWPFPGSLMLGFTAVTTETALQIDPEELESAQWFTRSELTEAVRSGHLALPGAASISRHLITRWYGEPLPK